MKMFKRMAAAAAAFILAMTVMTAGAFAEAEPNVDPTAATIVIDGSNKNTYKAYQIFVGTPDAEGKFTSNDIAVGSGVNADALFAAITGADESASPIIFALDYLSKADAATVTSKLKSNGVLSETFTEVKDGTELPLGYYYIEETDANDNTLKGDLLKIAKAGELEIKAKIGAPRAEKKVIEEDYTVTVGSEIDKDLYVEGYNDAADYSFGEQINFQIVGTMPQNIADYDHYYYEFTDCLAAGFVAPDEDDFTVTVGGVEIVPDDIIVDTDADTHETTIRIIINDIKDNTNHDAVTADSVVKVNYTAVLDDDAVIGAEGNTNGVHLTYTTNPGYDGEGYFEETQPGEEEVENTEKKEEDTEDTTEDGVVVYTYELKINKTSAATGAALQGVKFSLQNAEGHYANINTNGKLLGWVESADASNYTFETGADGKLTFTGLDSGTYRIVEQEPLEGYEPITGPISFTITPNDARNTDGSWTYTEDDGTDAYGAITVENDLITVNDGTITANVENEETAYTLPETGGIGTTIFYVGGGITAAAAGIVLVARRRAKKDQ